VGFSWPFTGPVWRGMRSAQSVPSSPDRPWRSRSSKDDGEDDGPGTTFWGVTLDMGQIHAAIYDRDGECADRRVGGYYGEALADSTAPMNGSRRLSGKGGVAPGWEQTKAAMALA